MQLTRDQILDIIEDIQNKVRVFMRTADGLSFPRTIEVWDEIYADLQPVIESSVEMLQGIEGDWSEDEAEAAAIQEKLDTVSETYKLLSDVGVCSLTNQFWLQIAAKLREAAKGKEYPLDWANYQLLND